MLRILQQFILTTLFAIFASQASAMFIQADWLDPTQPGVGTNRYSYSFNDPINLSDPNGNHVIQDDHGDLYNDNNDDGEYNLDDHVHVGNINDISEDDLFAEFERDDQRDISNGRYDTVEYYSGSFGNDIATGNYNSSALSPIHTNNGQAMNLDGVLYGAATLPLGAGLSIGKGFFGLGTSVAPTARSLSAAANPALQTTADATKLAKALEFRKIGSGPAPIDSHGQAVFTNGKKYISRDHTSHIGGVWKVFDRRGHRMGTFNRDLTVRIGD